MERLFVVGLTTRIQVLPILLNYWQDGRRTIIKGGQSQSVVVYRLHRENRDRQ